MKMLKKKITKRIIKTKREILDKIKIYIAYFKIKFLNEIQYKIAAFAGVVTQFVWGGMYIMLYTAFLKNGSSSDYTVAQISTYIWLQQAFYVLFNIWSIDNDILEQCENGSIAMELIRPVNLYSIWHAKTLGKKIAMVTLRAIPIIIICSSPTSIWAAWNEITAPKANDITPSSGHWRFPASWEKCWQWIKNHINTKQ